MALANTYGYVGTVGPNVQGDGATPLIRLGRSAEVITQPLHGRYYETTYRRNVFTVTTTGRTTSAGTTATFTGLALYNPLGSSVNVVVLKYGYAFIVAFAAASSIGLMTGTSTTAFPATNPVTPYSQLFTGGGGGQAGASFGCTLPILGTINTV